jgi:hypothetical protein
MRQSKHAVCLTIHGEGGETILSVKVLLHKLGCWWGSLLSSATVSGLARSVPILVGNASVVVSKHVCE